MAPPSAHNTATKRHVVALAVALAWLFGCAGHSSTPVTVIPAGGPRAIPTPPVRRDASTELPEPPAVRSVNGVARVALQVTLNGSTGFPQFVYHGMSETAPTIRVKPGDTIVLNVTDDLPKIRSDRHDVNIHFHGLGTSPRAPGDDVLGMLARPGQSLHYVVHVAKNQEPGLYWYHPHVHGAVNYQVGEGGMSGAIVVEGLEKHLPALAKMTQHVIVVRAIGVGEDVERDDDDAMSDMSEMDSPKARPQAVNSEPCGPDLGVETTLNNVYQPVIPIAPGEKEFFRVINATGHKTLKLWDGGDLVLVAIDGFALDTWPGTPATETVTSIVMPPASRAEFVVTGPRNGYAAFRTLCYDSGIAGDRDPNLKLAELVSPNRIRGDAGSSGPLRVGAPLPRNAYTTPLPPIAAKRVVTFSETPSHFLINHKAFKISDPPMFVVHVGTVEEWEIRNITGEIHDFHLHQAHFLVKEINGVEVAHPHWADSVVIPHRQKDGRPGTLRVIADFRDPIIKGTFVFHCHILDHEDRGMMAKIEAI